MWVRAKAMLRVPRVTMNGGSRTAVTRDPLNAPNAAQTASPRKTASRRVHAAVDRELGHDDVAERHHGAVGQVDARGEDDQGLADGEGADDHDLLDDERQVATGQEPGRLGREEGHGEQQRDERTEGREGERPRDQRRRGLGALLLDLLGGRYLGHGHILRSAISMAAGGAGGGPGLLAQRASSTGPALPELAGARQPQQFSRPNLLSLASTPSMALSVMRVTPVSV